MKNKLGLMMAAIMIAGYSQVALAQNLDEGLVAYYPFNGNANDESGNVHDGQVIGATLEVDRHGKSDSAYRFNGSSVISIKESNLIQFTKSDPMSISLWVKNESSGTVHLLGMRDPSKDNGKSNYQIDWTNGALNFRGSPYNNGLEKTGGTLPNNKYQHVVVSYDGKRCKLYLDSTLIMNEAFSLGENVNTPLLIGGSGNHRKFTGVLDDIRIYNRAITGVEVAKLYEEPKDDLVAYYPFNGNANDESGNGNHGEVIGAELSTDRHGKKNAAYNFDGENDWILIPLDSDWDIGQNDFSYSYWIKTKDSHGYIFDARDQKENGFSSAFHNNHKGLTVTFGGSNKEFFTSTGQNSDNSDKWNHFTVVRAGKNITIYKNSEVTKKYTTPILQDIKNSGIGKIGTRSRVLSPTDYFKGSIDEIRVYNRALSSGGVDAIYLTEKSKMLPKITAISENTVADEGETIELTVVADGEGPLLYSWKKTGSNVELSNTTNLVLSNVDEGDAGSYYVVVSNEGGKTDSATVEIDIRPDTDNDGLLDYEEIALGSDINKADTDGDGLSDFDEVDLFSTSPIRSDTDGDGLDDGTEIRGGFDPRKPTESADGSISIKVAVELEFFTLTWNNYQLQRSKDLIKWQDVDALFKGVGGYSSILQPARKDKIYWRLIIVD